MVDNLASLVKRLETAVNAMETIIGSGHGPVEEAKGDSKSSTVVQSVQVPVIVSQYDSQILSKFASINESASKIDPQITSLTNLIHEAYNFNRTFLGWTTSHKKPSEEEAKAVALKLSAIVKKVGDLKDNRNPFANFFLFGLEVAQSTLWITSPMPVPTAESFIETSAFYGNKILKEKQENQVVWVKALNDLIKGNCAFVKEHFQTGVMWNPKGKDFAEALKEGSEEKPKAKEEEPVKKSVEEVKVAVKPKKEPKKFERGISWVFEYFENNRTLELPPEETGMKKAVMIDNCLNCVIQIKGKVKSIILSGCKGTSVVFQDIVSTVEVVNCQKINLQSTGLVSSLSVDKSDGIQIYLTREHFAEITVSTSKSADINIVIPGPTPDDDMIELPIPHQFQHKFEGTKIKSTPSDLYSH